MKDRSPFGEGNVKDDNLFKKAGKGAVVVGTVVCAGVLVGMGFEAFRGASENI